MDNMENVVLENENIEVAEEIVPEVETEELEGEDLEAVIDALLTDTEQ